MIKFKAHNRILMSYKSILQLTTATLVSFVLLTSLTYIPDVTQPQIDDITLTYNQQITPYTITHNEINSKTLTEEEAKLLIHNQLELKEIRSNTQNQELAMAYVDSKKIKAPAPEIKEKTIENTATLPKIIAKPKSETILALAEPKSTISRSSVIRVSKQDALLQIKNPDPDYKGRSIELSESDRDFLERLVQGEAGAEGYEGAALVAQAIHDTMITDSLSVKQVQKALSYSGSTKNKGNEDVKKAVAFIFDEGGMAVQHRIIYFYAPKIVKSGWHETQHFVIEHNGHRVFDRK